MLCGSSSFAVKWQVRERGETTVYGSFAFIISGHEVGDYSEYAHLKGCRNWMRDFIENPMDRFEPGLFEMDKIQAYRVLANSILHYDYERDPVEEIYENISSRFHVGHIGMSSMDDSFVVLFMENEAGEGRFIWKAWKDEVIKEAYVAPGEVVRVFTEAVAEMTREFG